jgi:putative SOS response-associated peptidase YedK
MPVMLQPDLEEDWLDPDVPAEHALSLLEPYPAEAMRSVAVSPLVNNVKNEGPELLERVETPHIGLSESDES